jgi:hypothetical protein
LALEFFQAATPLLSFGRVHKNPAIAILITVHEQPKGTILSLFSSALDPHQPFFGILGTSLANQ